MRSSQGPRVKERGRRGAPPRGGADNTPGSKEPGWRLTRGASRTCLVLGRRPTAANVVRSTALAIGSRRLESGIGVRVPRTTRYVWIPELHAERARPLPRVSLATCRIPSDAGAYSRGEESQESTDPVTATPARVAVVARTDSRGEQGFEVGVPAVYRRARSRRADLSRSKRFGASTDRSSLTGIRSSWPMRPGKPQGKPWQRVGAAVKVG